jgi:hypothetical protein
LSNGTIKKDAIKGFAIGRDFQLESNNCTSSLAAGQSCNYEVSFQPLQRGNKHQQLQVTIGGSTQTVKLRGVAKRVRN